MEHLWDLFLEPASFSYISLGLLLPSFPSLSQVGKRHCYIFKNYYLYDSVRFLKSEKCGENTIY